MDHRKIEIPPTNLNYLLNDVEESQKQRKIINQREPEKIEKKKKESREANPFTKFILTCLLFSFLFSPLLLLKNSSSALYFLLIIIGAAIFSKSA